MKKKLTTLLTLALVAVFALALVACDDNSGNKIPTPSTSEKGNTYKQSKFVVEWESEEAKNDVLNGMTEEQFMQMYNGLKTTMIFSDDDSVSVTAPGFPPTGYSKSLFYSKTEDGSITFYETLEEKANGTAFKDEGFFEYTFVISKDYTTISMIGTPPGAKCEIVLTIV